MILTREYLEHYELTHAEYLSDDLKEFLLDRISDEPFPYEWSERDIIEQMRSYIHRYNHGHLVPTVRTPYQRLRDRYEDLMEEYCDLASRYYNDPRIIGICNDDDDDDIVLP